MMLSVVVWQRIILDVRRLSWDIITAKVVVIESGLDSLAEVLYFSLCVSVCIIVRSHHMISGCGTDHLLRFGKDC